MRMYLVLDVDRSLPFGDNYFETLVSGEMLPENDSILSSY